MGAKGKKIRKSQTKDDEDALMNELLDLDGETEANSPGNTTRRAKAQVRLPGMKGLLDPLVTHQLEFQKIKDEPAARDKIIDEIAVSVAETVLVPACQFNGTTDDLKLIWYEAVVRLQQPLRVGLCA